MKKRHLPFRAPHDLVELVERDQPCRFTTLQDGIRGVINQFRKGKIERAVPMGVARCLKKMAFTDACRPPKIAAALCRIDETSNTLKCCRGRCHTREVVESGGIIHSDC